MAVTILECLQIAQMNFENAKRMPMVRPLAEEQLSNAIALLEKGYAPDDEVEPLLEEYGGIESVPYKE